MSTLTTRPPEPAGVTVLLYDGDCQFCSAASVRLAHLAGPGRILRRSFQDPGVLDSFPGVTYDACMKAMHLVEPDGAVFTGAESVARALRLAPLGRLVAWGYYVPGIRQLADAGYRVVAANRYRFNRKQLAHCEGGTCQLHMK